jgi:hypothetical protein
MVHNVGSLFIGRLVITQKKSFMWNDIWEYKKQCLTKDEHVIEGDAISSTIEVLTHC